MPAADEAAAAKTPLGSALQAGIEVISLNDAVVFTKYNRLVSPFDGTVYWVKQGVVSHSALFNTTLLGDGLLNGGEKIADPPTTLTVKGSFHYSTRQEQSEAETEGASTVIFSALEPIQAFNAVGPDVLWIGTYQGDAEEADSPIMFAFSNRGRYYKAADLFHYSGTAVLPAFRAQLVDSVDALAGRMAIVSNSLPIWLSLSGYQPPYPGFNCSLALFPSFLVPDNLPPPYGVVHIEPSGTLAIAATARIGHLSGHHQLSQDKVRVTLYGLDNEAALTFLDAVNQFSYDYCSIGMMSNPVVKDEKRTQAELLVIAQKKTIDFDVSYFQHVARDVARQLILSSVQTYIPEPLTGAAFTVETGE